jgi:hypothetical protein
MFCRGVNRPVAIVRNARENKYRCHTRATAPLTIPEILPLIIGTSGVASALSPLAPDTQTPVA